MPQIINATAILDEVLLVLFDWTVSSQPESITKHLISKGLLEETENNYNLFLVESVFTYMEEEGFIVRSNIATNGRFILSIKGRLLYQNGGFYELQKRQQDDADAVRLENERRVTVDNQMVTWTRKATKAARWIIAIEVLLLVAAFASIAYDHPNAFPWIWCD